jgi:hypothetical protein
LRPLWRPLLFLGMGQLGIGIKGPDVNDRIVTPSGRAISSEEIGTLAGAIATGINHVYWITPALALAVLATALLLLLRAR